MVQNEKRQYSPHTGSLDTGENKRHCIKITVQLIVEN